MLMVFKKRSSSATGSPLRVRFERGGTNVSSSGGLRAGSVGIKL